MSYSLFGLLTLHTDSQEFGEWNSIYVFDHGMIKEQDNHKKYILYLG